MKLADMEAAVQRTRVVLSVVGPYALYGTPLVEACVKHGVDYVDLTGAWPPLHRQRERHRHIEEYSVHGYMHTLCICTHTQTLVSADRGI